MCISLPDILWHRNSGRLLVEQVVFKLACLLYIGVVRVVVVVVVVVAVVLLTFVFEKIFSITSR